MTVRFRAASAAALVFISLAIATVVVISCNKTDDNKPADDGKVKLTFIVTPPDDTDAKDILYVCGGDPVLGSFSGSGLALARTPSGEYTGSVRVAPGTTLEYKITRGSWDTVEKGPNGEELANRRVIVTDTKNPAEKNPAEKSATTTADEQTERIKVQAWRDQFIPTEPTLTGDIRYHDAFHSKILKNDRRLIVWLPPDYEKDKSRRYPVLYMHDGQNLFDDTTSFAGEWHADEIATRLIEEGKIEPIIIVGIENHGPDRTDEYTPSRSKENYRGQPIAEGGKGEQYCQFLIEEVKPFIDTTYRTLSDREHTAVAGSSLGGLLSLYMSWKHHDVFGRYGVISPSLWWDKRAMLWALETDHAWMRQQRFWVDMGTNEGSVVDPDINIRNTRELTAIMQRAGLTRGKDFEYYEAEGASHNEQAWSQRFDRVLVFLFGTER